MSNEPKKITPDELKKLIRNVVKTPLIDMIDVSYDYIPRQAYNTMIASIETVEEEEGLPWKFAITEVNKLDSFNRLTAAFKKIPASRDIT